MTMPTCNIVDLAEVLIEHAEIPDVKIVARGTCQEEKTHERLMSEIESKTTIVYDDHYLVILPAVNIPVLKERYKDYKPVTFSSLSSEFDLMTKEEIKDILLRGGILT